MNWGKWIVVSFALFAGFIGTLVVVCVKQEVNLVAQDYYQEELAYQQQIDRLNNTGLLNDKPVIKLVDNKYIQISFDQFNEVQKGELKLFRPSNEKLDRQFALKVTADTVQRFDLSTFDKGMYRAQLSWTMNGKEFYLEEIIYI